MPPVKVIVITVVMFAICQLIEVLGVIRRVAVCWAVVLGQKTQGGGYGFVALVRPRHRLSRQRSQCDFSQAQISGNFISFKLVFYVLQRYAQHRDISMCMRDHVLFGECHGLVLFHFNAILQRYSVPIICKTREAWRINARHMNTYRVITGVVINAGDVLTVVGAESI